LLEGRQFDARFGDSTAARFGGDDHVESHLLAVTLHEDWHPFARAAAEQGSLDVQRPVNRRRTDLLE
jgi:hypothetical protein